MISGGSTDGTMERLRSVSYPWLHVIDLKCNSGKANALNMGLSQATYPLTITLDADSYLYRNAVWLSAFSAIRRAPPRLPAPCLFAILART